MSLINSSFEQAPDGHHAHVYTPNGNYDPDTEEAVYPCAMYEVDRGEIQSPPGWNVWYLHDRHNPPPWDPTANEGYAEPEVRPAPHEHRSHSGLYGQLMFTFFRANCGGYWQQVTVNPDDELEFYFYAHAWSSNEDNSDCSSDVGCGPHYWLEGEATNIGQRNVTFWAGIDPTGGTDPIAPTVIWGQGIHSYNRHHKVPSVVAVAQSNTVTIFVKQRFMWRFKHSDGYIDDATITGISSGLPNELWIPNGSKLSLHGIGEGPAIVEWLTPLLESGFAPRSIKGIVDVNWFKKVKAISPETLTVARFIDGKSCEVDNECPPLDGNLKETAQKVMDCTFRRLGDNQEFTDYLEVTNELDPPGIDGHLRYAEFFVHCMDIAESRGQKLVLFSYSMGVPELEEWQAITASGFFARAKVGGHALALHEYANPIQNGFGLPLPGQPTYPDRGIFCCRYRWLYEDILKPRDEVIPLFITETNWATPMERLSLNEWLAGMEWYDNRLREDYYVLGAHIFTVTGIPVWEDYDIQPFLNRLVTYQLAIKDEVNAMPELSPEPPMECLGQPREDYMRTYHLLPGHAPLTDFLEVAELAYPNRATVGFSADDAMIGALSNKTAILWNISQTKQQAYIDFRDEHYPNTKIEFRKLNETEPPLPNITSIEGVHSAPVLFPSPSIDVVLSRIARLDLHWYKVLYSGEDSTKELIERLVANNVEPIIRLFIQQQFPGRIPQQVLDAWVTPLIKQGAQYIEIGNEPNLSGEWKAGYTPTWQDDALVRQVAADWWTDAQYVVSLGGKPGLMALAPTERNGIHPTASSVMWNTKIINWLAANHYEQAYQWLKDGTLWIAVHVSDFGRPFDYNPYQDWGIDDMCLRGYEWLWQKIATTFNGVTPIMASTEGGVFSPIHLRYLGWPSPYSDSEWGQRVWDAFKFLDAANKLSTVTMWTMTDEGVADHNWLGCGWYDRYGNSRSPVLMK